MRCLEKSCSTLSIIRPQYYIFEIRNEPADGISTANWRVVSQAIIDTIRNYDTHHTIITGAAYWNNGDSLYNLVPFIDTNIIYTFHNYYPDNFTHQGLDGNPTGIIFPVAEDVDSLRQMLIRAKNWSLTNNLPIWLGEIGCSEYGDSVSRCNWATTMGFFIDSLTIPYAYFEGFKLLEPGFGFISITSLTTDSVNSCFANVFNLATGVNEISNIDLSISLYPNPANQTVTLVFDNSKKRTVH